MSNPSKQRKYDGQIIKGIRKFFNNTACDILVTCSLVIVNLHEHLEYNIFTPIHGKCIQLPCMYPYFYKNVNYLSDVLKWLILF